MRIGALFPNPATCCAQASSPSSGRPWKRKKGALLVPQRAVTEVQGNSSSRW